MFFIGPARFPNERQINYLMSHYFLMAPLSRIGTIFGASIASTLPKIIAAVDDFHAGATVHGVPCWSGAEFVERAKHYPNAKALDLSTSAQGKIWVADLINAAGIHHVSLDSGLPTRNCAYAPIIPRETFSPWLADIDFLKTVSNIYASTLVDHYRLWELWSLVAETGLLPGGILEVGVWRGGTGTLMARRMQMLEQTGPLYLCDTFYGVIKASEHDNHYTGGEHADTTKAHVKSLLKTQVSGFHNVHLLSGVFPDETGNQVGDSQFRLVHIDVDTYLSAKDIFDFVWPRMPAGGIIVYDDYGCEACAGIVKHVEEQRGKPGRLVIHNLNGHALIIKLSA